MIDAPAIIGGSVIGAKLSRHLGESKSGQPGLFIGAIMGGIIGVVLAVSVAVRLRLIPASVRGRTIAGGMVGFTIACISSPLWDSPVAWALTGAFVPLGAAIASRAATP